MSSSFTVSRRGRIRKRVRSTLKRDDVFPPTISSPHAIVLLPDAGIRTPQKARLLFDASVLKRRRVVVEEAIPRRNAREQESP